MIRRFVRMASLLVTFHLVIFATSASAECAWVLWESKQDFNADGRMVYSAWTILRTYDSLPPCRTDQATLLTGETSWHPGEGSKRLDDGFRQTFYDAKGKVTGSLKQRALCIPGTLDPRGPKGK
jgi:hypothetical protein